MQSGTLAATLLCATAPAAKAGHEVPYYPSFYPQEIRIEPLDPECLHRRPGIGAHDGGCVEPRNAVHQVGAQQRCGKLRAAFHQQVREALVAESGERLLRIDADFGTRDLDQRGAYVGERASPLRISAVADHQPGGRMCGGDRQRGGERCAQMAVGHDADHRIGAKSRDAAGQFRVVRHDRPDTDHHRVMPPA